MLKTPHPSDLVEDSKYQAELQRGFRWLRFEPAIEHEFQTEYLASIRWRVIICMLMSIAATAWIAATNERTAAPIAVDPEGMAAGMELLRTWLVRPLSLLMVVAALYRPLFMRSWLTLAPAALVTSSAVGCFSVAGYIADGNLHAFSAMLVGSLASFLLLGMLFWQIVFLGTAMTVVFYLSLAAQGAPLSVIQFEITVMLVLFALVSVFFHNLERNMRASFLQSNVLRELGHRDVLTGLKNRRAFDTQLKALWRQALRDGQTIGLLICDVDDFKAYNDRYGHPAGDTALLQVAQVLATCERRPLDLACRVGGEEFAVVFYATSEAHLRATCERILAGVRDLNIPHAGSRVAEHVTMSVGATIITPSLGRAPESLIGCADEALYDAKDAGRDQYAWKVLPEDGVVGFPGAQEAKAG